MGQAAARIREQPMAPTKSIDARERLILALDAPINPARRGRGIAPGDVRDIIEAVGDDVRIVKVGWPLFLNAGPKAIEVAKRHGKTVFLDLKCVDIPNTIRHLVVVATERRVEFITVDTTIQALEAAIAARKGDKPKVLFVTALTSLNERDLRNIGVKMPMSDYVLLKTRNARDAGCDGVICSGQEVAAVRKETGDGFLIVTPGIRLKGADHDDHKRAVTPEYSIKNGSDYLVVGRPITGAANPRDAARRVLDEMQRAFDQRRQ